MVSKTTCRGFESFCPCHFSEGGQPVHADIAQSVERILGKDEVGSSNLPSSSIKTLTSNDVSVFIAVETT